MAKLTKLDAARQLGIARSTLYKLIDQGHVSPTPDGFIDQAELVRVAAYVDTLKERTRTGTDRQSRQRTDTDTGQRDTHSGHEDGQVRPRTAVSGQTETGVGGQTRTVTDMLVDMLREQLQAAQAREHAAVEREQAAREREALLLQMLQQMQHRYDRLLEAPRPASPAPVRASKRPPSAAAPRQDLETATPAFNPTNHILGKLCPRGHNYQGTGQSLLRLPGRSCLVCDRERARERRQAPREQAETTP